LSFLRKQIAQQVFNFFSAKSRRHKEKLAETVATLQTWGIYFLYIPSEKSLK